MSLINKNIINAITFRLNELETENDRLDLLTEIFEYTEEVRYQLSCGEEMEEIGPDLVGNEQRASNPGIQGVHEDARGFDYQTGLPL